MCVKISRVTTVPGASSQTEQLIGIFSHLEISYLQISLYLSKALLQNHYYYSVRAISDLHTIAVTTTHTSVAACILHHDRKLQYFCFVNHLSKIFMTTWFEQKIFNNSIVINLIYTKDSRKEIEMANFHFSLIIN